MWLRILSILFVSFVLSGCPLEGDDGSSGAAGINCWDTNEDGVNDAAEDINKDGYWTVADCGATTLAPQNQDAILNFQHFCEAFANLGQYPDGCPSNTHTPPTGTLTYMDAGQFDGSYNTCSDLSIVTESSIAPAQAFWTLQGGFIAKTQILAIADNLQCGTICNNDANCVAAYFLVNNGTQSGTCNIMYHSDTISPYKHICGIDSGTATPADMCLSSIGFGADWWAICP
jgi:hypothetical protein